MTRARMPRPHEVAAARRDPRLIRAFSERHRDPAWRTHGVCQNVDPETFFPAPSEPADAALAMCRACDVQGACLAWALDVGDCHGVWGGTTPRERRAMLVAWRADGDREPLPLLAVAGTAGLGATGPEPVRPDAVRPEPTGREPGQPEVVRHEPVRHEATRREPVHHEVTSRDPVRHEATVRDHGRPDAALRDPVRPDSAHPGVGSADPGPDGVDIRAEFAELVTATAR